MSVAQITGLYSYHQWANRRLFDVAATPLLLDVVNHATDHWNEICTMITPISGSPPDTGLNTYRAAVVKG